MFSFSSFWLLIFNAVGGYLIAMNIIRYAMNLIIVEVGQIEHVKLTTLTNKTW